MTPALTFKAFSYSYPHATSSALSDLSLQVESGEFVLLCGSSGCGKSTLLRAAAGIVPHHYGGSAGGEAQILGRDLRECDAAQLAAVCATVLQDPETQAVMGGVEAELTFPLENAGWSPANIARAVEETSLALGISGLLGRRTAELSGGELQRVVMAASLVAGAKLLLLDEPTSQLDPIATEELLALLLRLNRDRGATVVVADHHVERFLEHVDRVVVLDDARVVCDASPAAMLEWAAAAGRRDLLPPVAEMFLRADESPLPVTMRQARAAITKRGLATTDHEPAATAMLTSDVGIARAPLATLRHVDFRYDGATENALSDVNLEIKHGEKIALIGANGSGKSSLLRLLKELQKPTRGRVAVSGEVALLLQNPNDYLLHERVGDEASIESLRRFGLEELVDCDPRDLSGGQRQRLALAIVMQSKPQLLLLDEPSRGMDRERRHELLREIDAVAAAGTAVVLATHDTDLAAQFATRALLLGRGRLLADAPVADVLGNGSYFGTAVAQLLPGTGALTATQGATVLNSYPQAQPLAHATTTVSLEHTVVPATAEPRQPDELPA